MFHSAAGSKDKDGESVMETNGPKRSLVKNKQNIAADLRIRNVGAGAKTWDCVAELDHIIESGVWRPTFQH